jgi:predicted GNAT family acetyltransferase
MTSEQAGQPPAEQAGGGERIELRKNVERQQYEIYLDGVRVGLATYRERDGVTVIPHTETLPAFGGRGLAGRLVAFALDDIRSRGDKVEPACPFVADYLRKNPSYQDLLP